jgi:flagellar assembly protein FliH
VTSSPSPFNFDLDLAGRPGDRTKLIRQSTLEDELNKARQEGYTEGFAEGERSTASEAAKAIGTAATRLAAESAAMNAALDDALEQLTANAARLALTAARKLAHNLVARQPVAEIEALLAECLTTVRDAPHMVVRCHPDLADAIRDTAQEQAKLTGFEGRLVVMGEPEIALGDCRIEWADGGLVRDMAATGQTMDNKIASFLTTHRQEPDGEAAEETEE